MGSVCFEIAAQAPDRDTDTDIVAIYSCSTYADICCTYTQVYGTYT